MLAVELDKMPGIHTEERRPSFGLDSLPRRPPYESKLNNARNAVS
jgi:hypothetical protein